MDGADETMDLTRRLSRVVELIHGVGYYPSEIRDFDGDGFRGWWHAYLAYRPAPMGPVDAPVVTAAFYNFAPRMVERAVPGVWGIMAPERVLDRRDELVSRALDRIFVDPGTRRDIAEAAELAEAATDRLDCGARPLAAAHAARPRPDDGPLRLWQACTVWREYRGDSHNLALAAAEIDGVECHVLMSAHGHGNQATISAIRGWTNEEWQAAVERLAARGIVDGDGRYTAEGRVFRAGVERTTDRLSTDPVDNLGPERAGRLYELLSTLGARLTETGEVPGVWPPPSVRRE